MTVSATTLVDRNTHKQIDGNANRKVFFLKRDKKYCWQIADRSSLAENRYSDTIHLKPKTWYHIVIERTTYDKFFYWNGTKEILLLNQSLDRELFKTVDITV